MSKYNHKLRITTDRGEKLGYKELTREYNGFARDPDKRTKVIFDERKTDWDGHMTGTTITVQRGTSWKPATLRWVSEDLVLTVDRHWDTYEFPTNERGRMKTVTTHHHAEAVLLNIDLQPLLDQMQQGKTVSLEVKVTDPATGETVALAESDPLLALASTE